ncbi:MFS transporter [Litoreibacter arenae]|uniref:Permease of the major facilitator superfamily n=1 Tax=Litoreibacter arenae DSM 19593 TaxID=1123360 RepID=S9QCI2_9RHOB|nr:MFS transporter [Litoreibacter arenae]EPX77632.1 Permease of the major facilitator superfamily [Litoreibacter arenae DSM 19593]
MGTWKFIRANLGWLSAGFLLTFSSSFGQTFFLSIFAGEIRTEFDLTHAAWGGIYMIGTLASAATMVWAGVLTDHFRVRVLGTAVLVTLAAACVSMAFVSSVPMLVVLIFMLRLMGQGMSSHVASTAMARWFIAARGRALAIASFGFSIGEALLPIFFVALMAVIGWRSSWLVAAGALLLISPLIFSLLKQERTPQSSSNEDQVAGMGGKHWTRVQVLRSSLFWLLVPVLIGPPAFGTAFFFLQVHLAEVKGWTHFDLVQLFPVYTALAICSMIASGFAIDRFGTGRMMSIYTLPLAVGFVIFSQSASLAVAAIGIAFFAMTSGMQATLPAAFWAEFFGTRHLGSIKAMATAIMVFGSAIGPGLTGLIIDMGVDYSRQMVWVAGYMVLATAVATIALSRARPLLARAPQVDVIRP